MTGKLFFILFFATAGILGAQEVKQETAAPAEEAAPAEAPAETAAE